MTPVLTTSHDDFNPRSPHGERLPTCVAVSSATPFQSTLPARGATRALMVCMILPRISIHAPRTGSDISIALTAVVRLKFQSTLPARGATWLSACKRRCNCRFQSTLPARGATWLSACKRRCNCRFQSTLPARGATRQGAQGGTGDRISIHAPRTGSDGNIIHTISSSDNFNPRSPHGERRGNKRFK